MRIVLALLLAALALPAEAQVRVCKPHDVMAERLEKMFREKPRASGLVGSRAFVELYVSETGSWTMIVTGTNGLSCILAAGEGWETLPIIEGSPI